MTGKIKVIHVIHWPKSGIVSLVRNIIPLLPSDRISSSILFFIKSSEEILSEGGTHVETRSIDIGQSYIMGLYRYYRYLRQENPDILHVHSFQPLMWGKLFKNRHAKLISTVHSDYPYFRNKGLKFKLKRALHKLILRDSSIVTAAVGRKVQSAMRELAVRDKKLYLIENGILAQSRIEDTGPWRAEFRSKYGVQEGDFVFVTVGRLDISTKGYDILLKAFNEVATRHDHAFLFFVGEGADRAKLEDAVAENLKTRVIFTGYQADPCRYLAASDVYVCSSYLEGFGLAVAEAMNQGLPVIATEVGSVPDMITDRNSGLIVSPGDTDQLAERMEDCLQNRFDLEAMGKMARKAIGQKYNIKKTADAYKNLYLDVEASNTP